MRRLLVHVVTALAFASLLAAPSPATAQPAPYGAPVLVQLQNLHFDVAATADGRYLVVSAAVLADGSGALYGRFFRASGRPDGPRVTLVAVDTWPWFDRPALAVGAGGGWILAWQRYDDIQGQLFAPDGTALDEPFTIFSGRVGLRGPALCSDAAGGFVVAWDVFPPGPVLGEIHFQRFDAAAHPVGPEQIVVDESDDGPALACAADGRFAVVWQAFADGGWRRYLARYGAGGELLEAPRLVNGAPFPSGSRASVAMTPAGEIAVLWGEFDAAPWIRFFDAAGRPGVPLRLPPPPELEWAGPYDVVVDADGSFTAVWGFARDDENEDFRATVTLLSLGSFGVDGRPRGPVRTLTEVWGNDSPARLRLALDDRGHLALVWLLEALSAQFFSTAGPGVLDFDRPLAVVDETDRALTVRVRRRAGSAGAVTADVVAVGAEARPGEDFEPLRATVRFGPGDSRPRSVRVPILDDRAVEGRETFRLELTDPTGGARPDRRATATVEIRDDDTSRPLDVSGAPVTVWGGAPAMETLAVAVASGDGFAVAWSTTRESDGRSVVRARRFGRGGRPREQPLVVDGRFLPSIVAHGDGGFSLLYQGAETFDHDTAIRLYLRTAAADEGWRAPILVHAGPGWFRGFRPGGIALASTDGGGYVLVGPIDAGGGVQVLSLDADGRPLGPVATLERGGGDRRVAFGLRAPNRAVAVWRDAFDGSGWGLVSRPLTLGDDGSVASAETVPLNREWLGLQTRPAVAVLASGRYLAVWQTRDEAAGRWRVVGRLLAADGRPVGGELAVSADAGRDSRSPAVAALAGGGAVVVWESTPPGRPATVRAQALDAAGRAVGTAWTVGGSPGGSGLPAVASNRAGAVVVVWRQTSADGDWSEIVAQRYRPRR